MGLFSRKNKKNAAAEAPAPAAPEQAPAESAAPAAAPANQAGDMFSGMNAAPSQGNSMFDGMQSAPAQGGDMFSGMSNASQAPAPAPTPAPAPAPAAPAQIQDPLMGARQKLMQISNQLRSEVVRLNEGERKVRENMTTIEGTISQMQDKLVAADSEEKAAIAAEDFAKAEEISNQSAALRPEIEAKYQELQQCLQRNGQATQLRVQKIQTELVTIDAMIKSFEAAFTHVNGQFQAFDKQLTDQASAHDARLAGMKAKIEESEEALAKKREAIAAEKEEVEKLVQADCTDLYKEKEEAAMLKMTLDQEIAELKEQLRQKNQELLACTKHIGETDQKIQQVRMKFMPQFQPIEEKSKALGGEVKSIETMKSQYATAESRVAMVKKQMDDSRKEKKEIVDTRKDELDVISGLASALRSYDETIAASYRDIVEKHAKMLALKKELDAGSITTKSVLNRIQALEKTVADSNAVIAETSAKLPELEQQKATAVESKNYKMAGQLTMQIKQLMSKKESATMAAATAQEELGAIRASSASDLAELETKKGVYEEARKAYLQADYAMLRKNAVTCRKASRSIEAIQRGDDTFRFACQALAASLFELTNADLTLVCNQLGVPALGDKDDEETPVETPAEAPAEAPEAAAPVETPAAEAAAPAATPAETTSAEDMFGLSATPSAAPAEDMFATMQAAPAALTKERATALATIAEAQMEKLNNDLDAAMADDKTEECEKLSEEIESLESYAGELKKFAAGTVTEEPKAPACFDEHFASKNAGDDLFLGM